MKKAKSFLTSERTFVFLLSATMVSIPLLFGFSTGSFLCLLLISLASLRFRKLQFNYVQLLPALLFALMCLSLIWTIDTDRTLKGLERQLLFVLVPLAFVLMPPLSRKGIFRIFTSFSIFLAILGLFFMTNALALFFIDGTTHQLFYHGLVLPMDLNAIYTSVMVAFALLYSVFCGNDMRFRWLVVVILSLFLILLSSKNVIPMTAICLFIGLFARRRISRRNGLIAGGTALVILVTLFVSPLKQRVQNELSSDIGEVFQKSEFDTQYPWTGTTIRLFQARVFTDLFRENEIFWLGFGMNTSQAKIVEKHKEYKLYFGFREYNFHNQYLQSFAELGIFGLLLTVGLLVALFVQFRRNRELLVLFFALLMTAVFATESLLWRHRGMLFFLLLYGLLLKLGDRHDKIEES